MKLNKLVKPFVIGLAVISATAAHAVPIILDSTFGTNGVTIYNPGINDQYNAVGISSAGKIIAAGTASSGAGGAQTALSIFSSTGTHETSTLVDVTASIENGAALYIDGTDSIYIAGSASTTVFDSSIALTHFDASGNLVGAFGTGGSAKLAVPTAQQSQGFAIAYNPISDQIIVGGQSNPSSTVRPTLAAFNPTTGALDTTFGNPNGYVVAPSGFAFYALAVDASGRIVAVGKSTNTASSDFFVARYDANGAVDAAFNGGNPVVRDFGGLDQARSVIIDGSGNIIVGGAGNGQVALLILDSNGTELAAAAANPTGGNDSIEGLAFDSAGNIVGAGYFTSDFGVIRFTPAGALDTTFNTTGWKTTDITGTNQQDHAYAVTIDSANQRIIAAGRIYVGTRYDMALAAFVPGNLPPTATNVAISGTPQLGSLLNGSYTYGDTESDLEGSSTYRWMSDSQISGATMAPIAGANAVDYTPQLTDVDQYLFFCVTPVAQTGTSPGLETCSPATLIPNAPPTATNVAISGTALVGSLLNGSYLYGDAESDLEGVSTFRWVSDSQISGATAAPIAMAIANTYTPQVADVGQYLFFCVTPVAQTGSSPGLETCSPASAAVQVPNAPPTATNVAISGTALVGSLLNGSYIYGDAESDLEGSSTFRWMSDSQVSGATMTPIATATANTYTPQAADVGQYLFFCVTPVALTGTTTGLEVCSLASAAVAVPVNAPPTATGVAISGTAQVGSLLSGSYVYGDAESDLEGVSTFRWMSDSQVSGATMAPIAGANTNTYTPQVADIGQYLFFCVTPVAQTGAITGLEACSPASATVQDDGDGVPAAVEDGVPNPDGLGNGDGNGDGILDRLQPNVASFVITGGGYATVVSSSGKSLTLLSALPAPADLPASGSYPFGALGFVATGVADNATEAFEVFLPYTPTLNAALKHSMTTAQWEDVAQSITQVGNKTRIAFSLTNGGPFDHDGSGTDGQIEDPVVPAVMSGVAAAPAPIPTLSLEGALLLTTFVSLIAFLTQRRQRS